MYIHNTFFRNAYRTMTVIFLFYGIVLHFSFTDGDTTAHNFSFFTVQSNLLCLICFLCLLWRDPLRPSALTELKFTATLCITVTFLVNHTAVLLGRTLTDGIYISSATAGILSLPMKSFLAHYFTPALVILDWLLFTPKGLLCARSPLKWMFAPVLYLFFTVVRALCCSETELARTGKFPYFFLNVDLVGNRVFLYIGIYFLCFLAVGYLIYLADSLLSKIPCLLHRLHPR